MDFDLDDPLGDLLSDDSNDSFFRTAKKKSSQSKASKHDDTKHTTKVADLFGIAGPSQPTVETSDQIISRATKISETTEHTIGSLSPRKSNSINSTSHLQSAHIAKESTENQATSKVLPQASAKSNSFDASVPTKNVFKVNSSDDLLDELGFDPKNPIPTIPKKKSNIIDDILNFSKNTIDSDTNKAHMATTRKSNSGVEDAWPVRGPDTNRSIEANTTSASKNLLGTLPRQTSTESRSNRPKRAPSASIDWLGLSLDDETTDKQAPTKSTIEIIQTNTSNPYEPSKTSTATNIQPVTQTQPSPTNVVEPALITTTDTIKLKAGVQSDERIVQSLQQQTNQLQTAISMKQQENALIDMQRKQHILIEQQEKQFNELMLRQSNRQVQLEAQIQQQQQQIHSYINMLMQQPSVGISPIILEKSSHQAASDPDSLQLGRIELENEVKRLELEKLRLEDTLENVRATHDQESELIRSSHRKQVELYEESLAQMEQRLQSGTKHIEDYHLNRYQLLKTDMNEQKQKFQEQIEKISTDYEEKIANDRLSYTKALETTKNDQITAIETIRQTKLLEYATVQDGSSVLHSLKSASDFLTEATGNLQSMRTNMETNIERLHTEKELQLNAREQRLNDQQKTVGKMVDKTETERAQLIELIRTLEIKLASAEQSSNEQQWMFRQKSAILDAERVSFEREKSFVREKQEAEQKRIKELEEKQYVEYRRLMDVVDSERESVWAEKGKLKTLERLEPKTNSQTQRQIEIDAAIQIAQDAAKSADTEREKCVELQRKFELKRRELIDKEKNLESRQIELEARLSEAHDQKQISERAIVTSKTLEQKLRQKMQSLQSCYLELTEREKNVAEAKIQLSTSRMELQRLKQQIRQSKCSLCRVGAQNQSIADQGSVLDDIVLDEEMQLRAEHRRPLPAQGYSITNTLLDSSKTDENPFATSTMKYFSSANHLNVEDYIDSNALLSDLDARAFDNFTQF